MNDLPAVRGSRAATEYRALPARARASLKIPEDGVLLWDFLVTIATALTDETDDRPWEERLEAAFAGRDDLDNQEALDRLAVQLTELFGQADPTGWVHRLARSDFLTFVKKGLGAARFDRLRSALHDDVAVVAAALRMATSTLMPYVIALQDMANLVTDRGGMSDMARQGPVGDSFLGMLLRVDGLLEGVVQGALRDAGVDFDLRRLMPDEVDLDTDEVRKLVDDMRRAVSDRSLRIVADLGNVFTRKIQGAKDALTASSDGISQAANSMIELIDRLLRSAFSDAEVLAWLDENYPQRHDLRYLPSNGKERPTKRGQALCFAAAGLPIQDDQRAFVEWQADVVYITRDELQKLKHADEGTPEELDEVATLLSALEGFFVCGIGFLWKALPAETVEEVYLRINPDRVVTALVETDPTATAQEAS